MSATPSRWSIWSPYWPGSRSPAPPAVRPIRPPSQPSLATFAAADATAGATLGTTGRWTDLQSRVEALTAADDAASYGTAIRLADTMLVAAANAAGLTRDSRSPDLVAAAVTTLPAVMTYAGATRTGSSESAALAVARYQVALGVEAVGTALPSAAAMSPDLTRAFDDFQAAATLVAPTALVDQLTTPTTAPAADDLARLVTASAVLDQAILTTLDHGLADRANTVGVDERIVLAEAGAAGLGLLALLWLLSPRRDDGDDPGAAGDSDSTTAPAPPQIALIGAEELLGVDELVHIGRAVRPRRRESDDAE